MNLLGFYQDIQEKLATNASSVPVYREQFTSVPGTDPETGYIAWAFETNYIEEVSIGFNGPIEGQMEVAVFSQVEATRYALLTEVLDIWMPYNVSSEKREGIGPVQLTNSFLHAIYTEGTIVDLLTDNEGQPGPDVPGVSILFRIKVTPGEA